MHCYRVRKQYDPREHAKAAAARDEAARAAAKTFFEDMRAGLLNPRADDFNQGEGAAEAPADDGCVLLDVSF